MVSPLTTLTALGVPSSREASAKPLPVATSLKTNCPERDVPQVSRFRVRRHSPPILTLCLPRNHVSASVVVDVICGLRKRHWLLRPSDVSPVMLTSGTPSPGTPVRPTCPATPYASNEGNSPLRCEYVKRASLNSLGPN